jgi:hypothetical protein
MINRLRVSRLLMATLTPLYFLVPTIRVRLRGRQYVGAFSGLTLNNDKKPPGRTRDSIDGEALPLTV